MMEAHQPRFVADAMLGGLARWLRLLGIDTACDPDASDDALIALARREDRTLLSQDRHLLDHARGIRTFRVSHGGPLDQLHEIVRQFHLVHQLRPFTRCNRCNAPLVPLPSDFAGQLPADLAGRVADCTRCPGCGRIYWLGAHTRRIRSALDRVLGPGAIG